MLGRVCINDGFYWGSEAGIYCDVLRGSLWSPVGVAKSPEGDGPYGSPPGPYFSMKKSRQKSLGECPETPDASVHPARKAKSRLPGAGLDDAYKVDF